MENCLILNLPKQQNTPKLFSCEIGFKKVNGDFFELLCIGKVEGKEIPRKPPYSPFSPANRFVMHWNLPHKIWAVKIVEKLKNTPIFSRSSRSDCSDSVPPYALRLIHFNTTRAGRIRVHNVLQPWTFREDKALTLWIALRSILNCISLELWHLW